MPALSSLPPFPLGSHPDFSWSMSGPERAHWASEARENQSISGTLVRARLPDTPGRFALLWVPHPPASWSYSSLCPTDPSLSSWRLLGTYPCGTGEHDAWEMKAAAAAVARVLHAEFGVELSLLMDAIDGALDSVLPPREEWSMLSEDVAPLPWRGSGTQVFASASWLLAPSSASERSIWTKRLTRWSVWQAVQVEAEKSPIHVVLYGLWRFTRQSGGTELFLSRRRLSPHGDRWERLEAPVAPWPCWNLLGGGDLGLEAHAHAIALTLAELAGVTWDSPFARRWWLSEAMSAFSPRRAVGTFLGRHAMRAIKKASWSHLVDKGVLNLAAAVHATGRPTVSWTQYLDVLRHRTAIGRVAATHRNRLPLFRLLPVAEWSSPDPFSLESWVPRLTRSDAAPSRRPPEDIARHFLAWPASTLQLVAHWASVGHPDIESPLTEVVFFSDTEWAVLPPVAQRCVFRVWLDFRESECRSLSGEVSPWNREQMGRWLSALTCAWYAACAKDPGSRIVSRSLMSALRQVVIPLEPATHLAPRDAWRHLKPDHAWRDRLQSHQLREEMEEELPQVRATETVRRRL